MDVINDDTLFQKGEIDVALLHKKNKSESFLLSCIKDSENSFSARAMMQEHHYFSDHTATMSDLMYLLECARQAETYIVHQYNKQPLDIHFILSDWSGQFTSDFLPLREFSSQEIKFRVFLKSSQFIKNRLISQDYHFEFYDETIYAEFKMSVKYMTDAAYEVIRKKASKKIQVIFSLMQQKNYQVLFLKAFSEKISTMLLSELNNVMKIIASHLFVSIEITRLISIMSKTIILRWY